MGGGVRRVAVVTGGASGIGKALVKRLRSDGWAVVVVDRDEGMTHEVAEDLGARAYVADVTDPAAVQALADWTVSEMGRVDFVANNAGVGPLAPFDELTLDDFHWVINTNFFGVLHGMKAFLPLLNANPEGGFMMNTASMAGLFAAPGMSAYSASKFAVVALTEATRAELDLAGSRVWLSVLTPAQVASNIGQNALARPGLRGQAASPSEGFLPPGEWMNADEAAEVILQSVWRGDLYIVTHPEALPLVDARHERLREAFLAAGHPPTSAPSRPEHDRPSS